MSRTEYRQLSFLWNILCNFPFFFFLLKYLILTSLYYSYPLFQEHADREWKFARSNLWLGYFDEGCTLPSPFNLIISPKSIYYFLRRLKNLLVQIFGCRKQPRARRRSGGQDGGVKVGRRRYVLLLFSVLCLLLLVKSYRLYIVRGNGLYSQPCQLESISLYIWVW